MKFKFYNREQELNLLKKSFLNRTVLNKKSHSFIIQGRLGVGKTRTIMEFINSIETDKQIHHKIPKFRQSKNVFIYNCQRDNDEPYQAFIELTKRLEEERKKFRILQRIGMLFISLFQIYDLIDAFEKLSKEINAGESEEAIRLKETKIFNKYIHLLKKRSAKAPIILYVQNVQWIDDHSLKLLQTLIDDDDSLWGMILLEEDEVGSSKVNVQSVFRELIEENKMNRLALKPLHKGYESAILEQEFGTGFFTTKEYEYIYANSEGCPGRLENLISSWINMGWLYQDGINWKKIAGFEEKIKPPYQRLLDLIITFLQDGVISKREEKLLQSHALEWNIPQEVVTSMIRMIIKAKELGFEIEERLHTGSIGEHAFLAHDKDRNRYILEYISNLENINHDLTPREVKHPHLLPSKDIMFAQDSIFVVNDYYDGKNLKEVNEEAHETRIKDNLKIALQIAEGLAELHRNNYIHGYLRPESIIKKDNGDIKIAAIDASQLLLKEPETDDQYISFASYFSPEQIEGKELTKASDVFSFGILFYELLTGELPFTGKTKSELKQAIRFEPFIPFEFSRLPNHDDIQKILTKCLSKNPAGRYQSALELVEDLEKLVTKPFEPQHLPPEFPIEKSPKPRKKVASIGIGAIGLVILSVLMILFFIKKSVPKHFQKGVVVIQEFKIKNHSSHNNPLKPKILRYLIKDDILQSSSLNVMDMNSLRFLYGENVLPQIIVKGEIVNQEIGFTLDVEIEAVQNGTYSQKYKIIQPSELLTGVISKITQRILSAAQVHTVKKSTFTQDWDAFLEFYKGEIAWEKLEITKAKRHFDAALTIDPDFVLAKLRKASVLRFEGNNAEALQLVKSIQPFLGLLSEGDSLKAEALIARLNGKLRREIAILKRIYSHFPSRTESPYDVAEAYYQICDINNAIDYYKKTLHLDNKFAKAYNHLAYCYTHLGEHEKALKNFRVYTKLDHTANSFDSMGDGFFAAGLLDSASWAKKRGIELDPKLNYLYWSLVYINLEQGKGEEARKNARHYLNNAFSAYSQSRANYLYALIHFTEGNYDSSLTYCQKAITIFDSDNIVIRNHELHWLLGRVYLKLNRLEDARAELAQMEKLVAKHHINATNYRMGIYKFMLHLKALIAGYTSDVSTIFDVIEEFDGPIRIKVKDHGNPFDLAYFNTSLGELFMVKNINRVDLAKERFNKALEYNPKYAPAHYFLWKLYQLSGEKEKAEAHRQVFTSVWQDADAIFKRIYGIHGFMDITGAWKG